jgi:glycosyltransferase involved in cell wall biosynthesis
MTEVIAVLIGPEEHGVVRYGTTIAGAAGVALARHEDVASCRAAPPGGADVYHWHFTDRLFGPSIEVACDAFVDVVDRIDGRHVVTMHDVPPAGGSPRDGRRAAAYRRVATRCDAVVVASRHERCRLLAAGIHRDVTVIPLAVVPAAVAARRAPPSGGRSIGVLGFVYPGKGHADVLAACDDLPPDVGVVALGRPSDGHGDLVDELRALATGHGRRFEVTGFLTDHDLATAIEAVDVPVVPARHISASASLADWVAGGRRPLVVDNDYSAELASIDPDLITRYRPHELASALRRALDNPSSTRRSTPVPAVLRLDAVAAAHRALFCAVSP